MRFSVWAPRPQQVKVRVDDTDHEMFRAGDGWWHADVEAGTDNSDYGFLLDGDPTPLPDPRSRRQPDGVHGLSRWYADGSFPWADGDWTGRVLPGSVVYELHVGTFTPEGTFAAAIDRLDYLVRLGVDVVELLPVNGFNGVHNWGYDGVLWFAVHEAYGGPEAYQGFVDACHRRGLAVFQDVVYNHLGPSGNYLPRFAPYLAEAGGNTWGASVNLSGPDSDEVRRYIVDNALMWLRDYHVDGLRLDAVHALVDERAQHVLEQLAVEVSALEAHVGRPLTLIAESDLNDPRLVTPREAGGHGLTAQWSDDFHHALHSLLTGERSGYYHDFGEDGGFPVLAKVLTRGFFHDGTWSSFRKRAHGRSVDTERMPAWRLLGYLQDHDQIGNRAVGDRTSALLSAGLLAVGATLVLTSPFTPMLFMGEEWGASTPWQFFTSHPEPELAQATAEGRKREFASHGWDSADVPDPQDPVTFARSKLDWSERERPQHEHLLRIHRELIALRRNESQLTDPAFGQVAVRYDADARWLVVHRGTLRIACNLAAEERELELDASVQDVLFATDEPRTEGRRARLPAESAAVIRVQIESSP
ncbi:MAG: malto-oligosyltrehalose trehalohydrolase [Geodermatophilaceae bacterium]|nr:malto-oligosyltrehalose trehalohydrolase [Geodermatophilaceae bacterium]MDQ3455832.1 malto-oligosyltrehalose trehalohydrolase [Actinomycetota bacterium]